MKLWSRGSTIFVVVDESGSDKAASQPIVWARQVRVGRSLSDVKLPWCFAAFVLARRLRPRAALVSVNSGGVCS